jgi:hypothetical protein
VIFPERRDFFAHITTCHADHFRKQRNKAARPGRALSSIGRVDAESLRLDLLEMDVRIVIDDVEIVLLRRESSDRAEHGVGGDDAVALGIHQSDAGVEQRLLGVEHIERRALADLGLLAHAGERRFGALPGCLSRDDRGAGRVEPAVARHHTGAHTVALDVGVDKRLGIELYASEKDEAAEREGKRANSHAAPCKVIWLSNLWLSPTTPR